MRALGARRLRRLAKAKIAVLGCNLEILFCAKIESAFAKASADTRLPKVLLAEALAQASGGAKRDRTADLLHAMQALSQLSYGPNL